MGSIGFDGDLFAVEKRAENAGGPLVNVPPVKISAKSNRTEFALAA